MNIYKVIRPILFSFFLTLSFSKSLYADDVESGGESIDGCSSDTICECINDSQRGGSKEVGSDDLDDSSSSSTEAVNR